MRLLPSRFVPFGLAVGAAASLGCMKAAAPVRALASGALAWQYEVVAERGGFDSLAIEARFAPMSDRGARTRRRRGPVRPRRRVRVRRAVDSRRTAGRDVEGSLLGRLPGALPLCAARSGDGASRSRDRHCRGGPSLGASCHVAAQARRGRRSLSLPRRLRCPRRPRSLLLPLRDCDAPGARASPGHVRGADRGSRKLRRSPSSVRSTSKRSRTARREPTWRSGPSLVPLTRADVVAWATTAVDAITAYYERPFVDRVLVIVIPGAPGQPDAKA